MTFDYVDLAWYAGSLMIAFALGHGTGQLHRAFVKITERAGS